MGNKIRNRIIIISTILYAALIFVLSSIPGEAFPPSPFYSFDKFVHVGVFGILAILVYNTFRYSTNTKHPFLLTLVVCIIYAATDEFHQSFVPGRHPDIMDFIADTIGIIVFGGISALLNPLPREKGNEPGTG